MPWALGGAAAILALILAKGSSTTAPVTSAAYGTPAPNCQWVQGVWVSSGNSTDGNMTNFGPPDSLCPSQRPPPGVTTPGVWVGYGPWSVNGAGYAWLTSPASWCWVPLPLGQINYVQGPGGVLSPTLCMGNIYKMNAIGGGESPDGRPLTSTHLANGPWIMQMGSLQPGDQGTLLLSGPPFTYGSTPPPSAMPSGFTSGSWVASEPLAGMFVFQGASGASTSGPIGYA